MTGPGSTCRALPALLAVSACAASTLYAIDAHAIATAWPKGSPATRIESERAVVTADRSVGLTRLILELRVSGASAGSVVLVPVPGAPTVSAAPAGAIERVLALVADGGSPAAPTAAAPGAPVEQAATLAAKETAAVGRWLGEQKLETASGFAAWLRSLDARTQLAVVALPSTPDDAGTTTLTLRIAYAGERPYYPLSAPAESPPPLRGLELWAVAETPIEWLPPGGDAAAPVAPAVDVELPGRVAVERLGDAVGASLGFARPPATLWIGRYDIAPVDRSRSSDVWLTVSATRKSDRNIKLLGPPFGPAGASSASPIKHKLSLPDPGSGEVKQRGGQKNRAQASTLAALALVGAIGYAVYAFLERRRNR